MANVTLFKGSTGLNSKTDPSRLDIPESGIVEMPVAVNVDISLDNRVSRRRGQLDTIRTESFCSIWAERSDCLYTSGTSLYRLNPDMSRTGIRSGMTEGRRTEFCKVNDKIYYINGKESGYVVEDTSYAWVADEYIGPTTWRVFSNPPIGSFLEYFGGRIYIAQGNILWFSESFAFNWFCLSDSFILFKNQINMIKAVDDGIYVGLGDSVWFCGSSKPSEITAKQVCNYPAILGTGCKVDGSILGMEGIQGTTVLWTSEKGICLGINGGQFKNLNGKKLNPLTGIVGTGTVYNDKYISIIR